MSDNPTNLKDGTGPIEGTPAFSDRPTVADLTVLMGPLVNWQLFGTHLPGITHTAIKIIERDRPLNTELQKWDLFSEWLQVDPHPSWEKVIVGLMKAKEYALASIVGDVTCTAVPELPSTPVESHGKSILLP